MKIEKLAGTDTRLYELVGPLVMRRSVLRQNNNYPFWTSRAHLWFVATDKNVVLGFIPVETNDAGSAKIDNYYIAGDDACLFALLLREIVRVCHEKYKIFSITQIRHADLFRNEGFVPVREWKNYVKMEYEKNDTHERKRI